MTHSDDHISQPHVQADQLDQRRRRFLISAEIVTELVKFADLCTIIVGAIVAFGLYLSDEPDAVLRYGLTGFAGGIVFIFGINRVGGYQFERFLNLRWQITRVALTWGATLSALLVFAFVAKLSANYSRGWAISWTLFGAVFLLLERGVLSWSATRWMERGHFARNVVLVGAGDIGQRLLAKLLTARRGSVEVVGIFDDRRTRVPESIGSYRVLGTTDDLLRFARTTEIDEIIVALPLSAEQRIDTLVNKLRLLPVDLRVAVASGSETFRIRGFSHLGDVPMLEIVDRPIKQWNAVAKWMEDKVLGALFLMLCAPLIGIVSLLIRCDSPGPIFFVQERFGFNNRPIRVVKFRTMFASDGDPSGARHTTPNDPRVTRVGRILRSLSIDELPQLINVLKGDMSLVGPRPHAIEMKTEGRLYQEVVEEYLYRHRVKPGITGWAQVNGLRGEVDSIEKAEKRVIYDLDYIERWSLWFDLWIILKSFFVVLRRENAY